MRFDIRYLAVFSPESEPVSALGTILAGVYADELGDEPDNEYIAQRLTFMLNHERVEGGSLVTVFRLSDDLFDEDDAIRLATTFAQRVQSDDKVLHFVKFYDTLQFRTYHKYAERLYTVEMRLREVLTFIFVETYGTNFYDLLRDCKLGAFPPDMPDTTEKYQAHYENQFHWLVFSQYQSINQRKLPTNVPEFARLIGETKDFDSLKSLLASNPISKQPHAGFLAGITGWVNSIEKLRNCIAHNRTPSRKAVEDFETAEPLLLLAIEQFFTGLRSLPSKKRSAKKADDKPPKDTRRPGR